MKYNFGFKEIYNVLIRPIGVLIFFTKRNGSIGSPVPDVWLNFERIVYRPKNQTCTHKLLHKLIHKVSKIAHTSHTLTRTWMCGQMLLHAPVLVGSHNTQRMPIDTFWLIATPSSHSSVIQSAANFEALLTFFVSSAGTNISDLLGRNVDAVFQLKSANFLTGTLYILLFPLDINRCRLRTDGFE